MAKIILFEHDNFGGKGQVFTSDVPNLHSLGWGDKVSSLIVIDGKWTLFDDINYKGTEKTVAHDDGPDKDGVYQSFANWGGANDKMSSIKKA